MLTYFFTFCRSPFFTAIWITVPENFNLMYKNLLRLPWMIWRYYLFMWLYLWILCFLWDILWYYTSIDEKLKKYFSFWKIRAKNFVIYNIIITIDMKFDIFFKNCWAYYDSYEKKSGYNTSYGQFVWNLLFHCIGELWIILFGWMESIFRFYHYLVCDHNT